MRDFQVGYSQSYEFLPARLEEIRSRQKAYAEAEGREKIFLLEMRSEFMMSEGEQITRIGSEQYDMTCSCDATSLFHELRWRLEEYRMSMDGINKLCQELCAFGRQLVAVAEAGQACVAVIVRMDVVTVQREGESLDEVKMRALMPPKLSPLYVWSDQTVLRRVMNDKHMGTLWYLSICKPEGEDEGVCSICLFMRASIGAPITELECGCRFHSHCIIRKLERDNKCPHCAYQVFDAAYLTVSAPHQCYEPFNRNQDLAQYGVPNLTSWYW
ncbi:uncharacterized protein LOC131018019 [Salvia miltiorrhiza]|uniref:uncharacterized protein LOC131018019 n=1 Tax=Salvia miltiorrhiza TaxID=226208 RepID=UPI0025ABDB4A|nr:uncharacterized protein LOC131018019 [Salvia miltiorrhiza]XP_057802747.1 uncharacterized protein LOC131018019 [Salvia miltiorrhiza]